MTVTHMRLRFADVMARDGIIGGGSIALQGKSVVPVMENAMNVARIPIVELMHIVQGAHATVMKAITTVMEIGLTVANARRACGAKIASAFQKPAH